MPYVFAVLVVGIAGLLSAPKARAISTAEIAASATSTECLDYQVIGICAWLYCTPFGCTVRTSIRVKHYIPELVVSAYENTGENPWTEAADMMALSTTNVIDGIAGGGGSSNEAMSNQHINTRFKNADAIGHPSEVFYKFLSSFGFSCDSEAVPFRPYLLSTFDSLAWRSGIPESAYPEALTPGVRELGDSLDVHEGMWSPIYPRSGFVSQTHDYKVAATVAQRVADIVTRTGQPHVYWPLSPSGGANSGRWPPDPVMEGDPETHKWQRLEPDPVDSCAVFPDGGEKNELQAPGDYVWALWRPYSCCKKRGQELLWFTGGNDL
ncbi:MULTISPECIES: TIGR03756 family integrating conjugative element protein [unclassified Modicisalibacter]|uniref:TIGR03756 family integrating conjugative element protein n=1 Tax=unclassified Modicisalibacter TaxID=2679913 RepID=UPI001CCEE752|nr:MULTISPECIES: TIGR03756 family integrating conjugative element protein [unclassified Modicisalibacter]